MSTVQISYFTDVLCIWAYAGQRRIDQLANEFGDDVSIETHFCSVFPDAWAKIENTWRDRGGFKGFNEHLNGVGQRFQHIEVNDRLWIDTRPRTSASAHLFLKAIEIIEREQIAVDGSPRPYLDRLSTRAAWEMRRAFFSSGLDVSDWAVHAELAERLGIEYRAVEKRIRSSEAVAQLAADYDLSRKHDVMVSPTLLMNDGRQRLHGNVGYRLIEANVKELLRNPSRDEASWC
jgi:predicted DsbA family dithiol-disulfide isomerase